MADDRACGKIGAADARNNTGSGIRGIMAYIAPLCVPVQDFDSNDNSLETSLQLCYNESNMTRRLLLRQRLSEGLAGEIAAMELNAEAKEN